MNFEFKKDQHGAVIPRTLRAGEFKQLLQQWGVSWERREVLAVMIAKTIGWAQMRAFCYGIIFAAFVLWVSRFP